MKKKTADQLVSERLMNRGVLLAAIEKRKQEAQDKDIKNRARYVAQELGEDKRTDGKTTSCFCFDFERTGLNIVATRFEINKHSMISRTLILVNGSEVFLQVDSRIECFVPGEWEKLLDRFYAEAEATHEERAAHRAQVESRRQAEEERKERAKWGL